ncbi:MAG TPA: CorA family divalent cation transporter [Candidatus Limnocylindria bacterium]
MTLRATLFDGRGHDREVELTKATIKGLTSDRLLWVDVDEVDEEALEKVEKALGLPHAAVAGVLRRDMRAELERFPELIRLRVMAAQPVTDEEPTPASRGGRIGAAPVRRNGGKGRNGRNGNGARAGALETAAIDILAAPNLVVTVHHGSIVAFDAFVETIHGDTRLGLLDAASFMAALVDSVLAVYLTLIEEIERRIDVLDELALRSGDAEFFLGEVVLLRRRVAAVRRALAPLRVALAPLTRPDLEIPELGKPWPGLVERLERTIDTVENARELLIGSFDVFMARNADRTNDIMKTLTILNAVLLPAVVVAGVMGMNFALEFFKNTTNFWLVIGAMLGLAAAIIGFSRWRGWI